MSWRARLRECANCGCPLTSDYADTIAAVLTNAPDSWDHDEAAEVIAIEYVRTLERRVIDMGGTLERWDELED